MNFFNTIAKDRVTCLMFYDDHFTLLISVKKEIVLFSELICYIVIVVFLG